MSYVSFIFQVTERMLLNIRQVFKYAQISLRPGRLFASLYSQFIYPIVSTQSSPAEVYHHLRADPSCTGSMHSDCISVQP